ncbi:hypothetical protein [Streptomyces sp. NPDC059564]|uniref:hypothetical protein n=1 Tax=Streptomyces sp. NPDC059564 TaxID=3346865 RepID=UPI0036805E7D
MTVPPEPPIAPPPGYGYPPPYGPQIAAPPAPTSRNRWRAITIGLAVMLALAGAATAGAVLTGGDEQTPKPKAAPTPATSPDPDNYQLLTDTEKTFARTFTKKAAELGLGIPWAGQSPERVRTNIQGMTQSCAYGQEQRIATSPGLPREQAIALDNLTITYLCPSYVGPAAPAPAPAPVPAVTPGGGSTDSSPTGLANQFHGYALVQCSSQEYQAVTTVTRMIASGTAAYASLRMDTTLPAGSNNQGNLIMSCFKGMSGKFMKGTTGLIGVYASDGSTLVLSTF